MFVAVASLAIGVGANTAMFGAVRAILMDPLSVERPEELHLVAWRRDARLSISQIASSDYQDPDGGQPFRSNFSYPIYEAMTAQAPEEVRLFAFHFIRGLSVAWGDTPALMAGGLLADGSYFSALGVDMEAGRPLTPADDRPGAPLVAVLSHTFWMRAFGGDTAAIGRVVRVNGLTAEVVGVTARRFWGLSRGGFFPQTDITLPLAAQPEVFPRRGSGADGLRSADDTFWLRIMARVPSGVSEARVESSLTAAFRSLPTVANQGDGDPTDVRLLPGAQGAQPVRGSSARTLYLLLGAGGVVLLIACVNLASLLLARGVTRRHELAIRRALGSGRLRLVRRSLMESLLLAGLGTAFGLLLAFGTREWLGRFVADTAGGKDFGRIAAENAMSPGVIVFAAVLGLSCALLFGALPALRLSQADPMEWLKQRSGGMPRLTAGRVLLSMQVAVSVPLLVGSALLLRTMANLGALELGFEPEGMYTFQFDPAYARVPSAEHAGLYLQVLEEVGRIPGVEAVSLMENPPLGGIISNTRVEIDGAQHGLHLNAAGPDFLRATGMRLVEGRMPGVDDTPDARRVAAVNVRLAEEVFGGASAVGRTLTLHSQEYEVIGVVNDSRYRDRRSEMPATVFPSALQRWGGGGQHVVIRSAVPVGRLERDVRNAVARVNGDLPVPGLTSQAERVADSTARERLVARLITVFGVFALLLASIGIHGMVAYSVSRRTREIGVRVAVGAHPWEVHRLMLRQVVVLCAAGLLVGVPVSLTASQLLESLLYGVVATDVRAVIGASVVLVLVALAAGFLPARRASRLDPLIALRTD